MKDDYLLCYEFFISQGRISYWNLSNGADYGDFELSNNFNISCLQRNRKPPFHRRKFDKKITTGKSRYTAKRLVDLDNL